MQPPRLAGSARSRRLGVVDRSHHDQRELAARLLDLLSFRLERSWKVSLGELPFRGGAAGNELDIDLGFPGKAAISGKPPPHALFARVIGGGGKAEIPELPQKVGKQARGMHDGRLRLERIVEPTVDGRARHELRDPLCSLRAYCARIETALAPDESHERHGRQASRLGLFV